GFWAALLAESDSPTDEVAVQDCYPRYHRKIGLTQYGHELRNLLSLKMLQCSPRISACTRASSNLGSLMRTRELKLVGSLFASFFIVSLASGQQNTAPSQSPNENAVEGTVVSVSRDTLVVRTDDNEFHLFTYAPGAVRPKSLAPGARARVTAGPADENGTRAASNVAVLSAAGRTDKGAQAAPVPEKISKIESDIKRESRRWRMGVEAGLAFNPELFLFGIQSQMGPIFHPRVLFRPNAEFAFGEVTDLVALNLEAIYRFSAAERRGDWTPFLGA